MKTYRGSAAAARNYVEPDRGRVDDYYLAEGTGVAERYVASPTSGVHRTQPLTGEAYETWVAGFDPETGAPKGRLRHDDQAVRFVEVTVNGPKSWSLAAELHPDVAHAYDAAQDRAATQIIGWLAEHATARVGPRGAQVQVPVQQIEAVTVRHHTSRAGDPHRHLHLQINARVVADGAWRGLHTVGVRDSLDAINGIGHAAVATDPAFRAALAAHGLNLNPEGEVAQLADYVGPFSTRAAQIGRNIDRYEADWLVANPGQQPGPALRRTWDARGWADGRPDKVIPQPGDALRRRWLDELHRLGFRHGGEPVPLGGRQVGGIDRDHSVATVLSRLAARRSGWNAADVRGEVEHLIARDGVSADVAARAELAEDLTARTLTHCVPLLARAGLPEHVRALTSRHVLDVETDLAGRLAARADAAGVPGQPSAENLDRLDAGQRGVVKVLAGDRQLVVVQGAAGAGKTTTLASARAMIEQRGQRLMVVTPTLKAAKIAADQIGSRAGSAAWLVHRHGYRWNENGAWTRLRPGDIDPVTGALYDGPGEQATLRQGDLMLVDEAGMLDQDTARALLTVADEHGARTALVGDRHQLPAVGRGGVLDLAARWADPEACLTLDTVHRFTRHITGANGATVTVADTEYADLSLAVRTGDDPGGVFDALVARGQILLYEADTARTAALVDAAVTGFVAGTSTAVVADTREQVGELNAAIRDALVTAGRVDDQHTATTAAGQRIGAGDQVATRRNDRRLAVANRDTWLVTGVATDGQVTVHSEHRQRTLPPDYVRQHVELGYASTVHGLQGDTADSAHLAVGEQTSAASAYVGMTRGRSANTAHLVADNLTDAREQWIRVFARDRADLGAEHAAKQAEQEASRYAEPRPLEQVIAELRQAWTAEQDLIDRLANDEDRVGMLREIGPLRREQEQQLPALETNWRHARDAAQYATQRADAAETHVATQTRTLRDDLLEQWASQRDAAHTDAATVRAGAGRLGLHRGDVARAHDRLTEWAASWQPYLPTLPTSGDALVHHAGWTDNQHEVYLALDTAARAASETAHPEHAAAQAAARNATERQWHAWTAYTTAQHYYQEALGPYGNLAHTDDPAADLRHLEDDITATTGQLQSAHNDVMRLLGDPAVRSQPTTRLDLERDRWRIDQAHDQLARASHDHHAPALTDEPQHHYPHPADEIGPRFGR